jgi:putative adenylate-forming enzyme
LIQILKHFLAAKWRWKTLRTRENLEAYKNIKASAMIEYVSKHSSFYHEHWNGHELNNWQHLPIVDKHLMMQNFDSFNTVQIKKEEALEIALRAEQDRNFRPMLRGHTVGLSSGTSGHRGLFIVSKQEQETWTGIMLARTLHSLKKSGERIAFFLRSNSNLYENIAQREWLQFCYFDLMAKLDDTVLRLNTFNPTIIVAPPSMLELLAREVETGRLLCKPKRLISVAEILEPQDKMRLETIFAVPVHQIYQATEGLLAVSCRPGSLHIQEDVVHVQLEVIEGDYVTPIITDLWRKTQPMIRYRLGDVLRLERQTCSCGSPWRVIKQIEGREGDVLEFSSKEGRKRIFPDALRDVMLQISAVRDYLVAQESLGQLRIHLETAEGFDEVSERVKNEVLKLFAARGCHLDRLEIIQGLPPREANTKRRRVIRKAS